MDHQSSRSSGYRPRRPIRPASFRGRNRSGTSMLLGVGLPVVVAIGAIAVYEAGGSAPPGGGRVTGTVLMAADHTAARRDAGLAPLVQAQNGPMLDPRGKRKAARAAQQAAAAAKQAGMADAVQAAVPNPNCTIVVPANPLTAEGLATPYQLVATDPAAGPCNEANVNQSAFVQAAVVTPAGQVTLYDPLVIDQGTQPLAPPAAVQVPAGSVVGIWFGFNGTNLTLASPAGATSLQQGNCVNGSAGSIFGQFASCNGAGFFAATSAAVQAGTLQVPPLGTATDGQPCPTVRDFSLVDQDQSDNVTSHILAAPNGQTGQNNAAARAVIQGMNAQPVDLANGSDNRLLDVFVLPTLGCTPWTLPNAASDNAPSPSLPLNELQAAAFQQAPIALIPLTDPMTLANNQPSQRKTNRFRTAVGQPPLGANDNGSGLAYCRNLFQNPAGIQRVFAAMNTFANGRSPDPAAATNLFTFLAMRGNQSFTNLGCQNLLQVTNPIATTVDGNNVVTAATFTPTGGVTAPTPTVTPAATPIVTPAATPTLTPTTPTLTPTTAPLTPTTPPLTPTTAPTVAPTTVPTVAPTPAGAVPVAAIPPVTTTVTVGAPPVAAAAAVNVTVNQPAVTVTVTPAPVAAPVPAARAYQGVQGYQAMNQAVAVAAPMAPVAVAMAGTPRFTG
jgi:hypothetical protein